MGRVLADIAAYEEEPHRLIFTCLFSLSLLCVSSYVELCTTYPVVLTYKGETLPWLLVSEELYFSVVNLEVKSNDK